MGVSVPSILEMVLGRVLPLTAEKCAVFCEIDAIWCMFHCLQKLYTLVASGCSHGSDRPLVTMPARSLLLEVGIIVSTIGRYTM